MDGWRGGVWLSLALLVAFVPATRPELTITPEDAHFEYRGTLDVMCRSPQPLAACQFRVNHWKQSFPLLEYSAGARSTPSNVSDDEGKLRYAAQYQGAGLESGECGLRLSNVFWGRYVVGCRVRTRTGPVGWQSALMTFRSGNPAKFNMSLTPSSAQVRPGGSVSVLCDATQPIDQCSVVVQREDDYVRFHEGVASTATSHYRYFGAGLPQGECGVELLDVTPDDSGPVWCWGESGKDRGTARAAIVTVITPPDSVKLTLSSDGPLAPGMQLTATCSCSTARPAAKLVWLLGGKMLRRDAQHDLPAEQWAWPWEAEPVSQQLQLTISPEQQGKELACVAEHPALARPLSAARTLAVKGGLTVEVPANIPTTSQKPIGDVPFRPKPVTTSRPPNRPNKPLPNAPLKPLPNAPLKPPLHRPPTNPPSKPANKPGQTPPPYAPFHPTYKPTNKPPTNATPRPPSYPNDKHPNAPFYPPPQRPPPTYPTCQHPDHNPGLFAHPQHPGNNQGSYPNRPADPKDPDSIYYPGPHAEGGPELHPHPNPGAAPTGTTHGNSPGHGPNVDPFQSPYPGGKPMKYPNKYPPYKHPNKYPDKHPWTQTGPAYGHHQQQSHHQQGHYPYFDFAGVPFIDPSHNHGFHSYPYYDKQHVYQFTEHVKPETMHYPAQHSGEKSNRREQQSSAFSSGNSNPQALYFTLTPGPEFGRQLGFLLTTLLERL